MDTKKMIDEAIEKKVQILSDKADKALKKERSAIIIGFAITIASMVAVVIWTPFIVAFLPLAVISLMIQASYSSKSSMAVGRFSGYVDATTDRVMADGAEKLIGLFRKAFDDCDTCPAGEKCSDEEKKKHMDKIKKTAPKKESAKK